MMRNILSFFAKKINRKYIVHVCVHKFACVFFYSMRNWNQQSAKKEAHITGWLDYVWNRDSILSLACDLVGRVHGSFAYRRMHAAAVAICFRDPQCEHGQHLEICFENCIRQTRQLWWDLSHPWSFLLRWERASQQPELIKCQLISDQSAAVHLIVECATRNGRQNRSNARILQTTSTTPYTRNIRIKMKMSVIITSNVIEPFI